MDDASCHGLSVPSIWCAPMSTSTSSQRCSILSSLLVPWAASTAAPCASAICCSVLESSTACGLWLPRVDKTAVNRLLLLLVVKDFLLEGDECFIHALGVSMPRKMTEGEERSSRPTRGDPKGHHHRSGASILTACFVPPEWPRYSAVTRRFDAQNHTYLHLPVATLGRAPLLYYWSQPTPGKCW